MAQPIREWNPSNGRPSHECLGRRACPDSVRRTDMWKSQFVGSAPMSGSDLHQFATCVASTPRG